MHVDLMEVLPVATKLAQSVDKGIYFCDMSMVGSVDGTLALGADVRNPSQAVIGQIHFAGKASRGVEVAVMAGRLIAVEAPCMRPAPVPACTPRAAARAAVASGVPKGIPAILSYRYDEAWGGAIWDFMPPGRPDFMRRIDGRNCAIRYRPP
jgi:hypothetical protein